MKNIKFSRLFAAMMFVAVLSFAGCKQQPEEEKASIYGTWVSESATWTEKWEISDSELKNYGNGNLGYAGNSVEVVEISDTKGYIYIKYTRASNPDWTYSETAADVGKWYALYYFDLTKDSVKISGATNYYNNGVSACDTLEEAKNEFTVEKDYMSEAVGHYSACTRE